MIATMTAAMTAATGMTAALALDPPYARQVRLDFAGKTMAPADRRKDVPDAEAAGADLRDRALATLMAAAQDGDKAAYARLLRDCEPIIRRAARRAGIADDRTEDVVQDTLLTLHNARHTYDPTRSFAAWLGVIAQRRAVDVLRRTGRNARREVHAPLAYEAQPDEGVDATRVVEAHGEARELHAAIAGLSAPQREAVERLALREQSLAEAAAETGRTTGALKVNLHRAIKALRQRLQAEDRHV